MAVTAFIQSVKASRRGISDQELGMDMGIQVPLSIPQTPSSAIESRHLEDPELALSFLKSIYKPLKRHYEWFRRTQRGQIKQYGRKARSRTEGYRWRGRSEQHVLTSGMDDYPRGSASTGELHLDLISWMAFFSRTMREISSFIGETDDEVTYGQIEKAILENIEGNNLFSLATPMFIPCSYIIDLHWSESEKMYCDLGVDSEGG
jgi:mannosyl-oligosaccharide glucosidase